MIAIKAIIQRNMKVKKAGCILINLETKEIGLVFRKDKEDYTFPKGHLEKGETIKECAIRETQEETGRKCHIILEKELDILYFTNPKGEDVENYFYLAVDDGKLDTMIPEELQEVLVWKKLGEVESMLSYKNLKDLWNSSKELVAEALIDNIIPAELTDMGICPTCFDKRHENRLYGNIKDRLLYEDEQIECFLAGNPRAEGHVVISSKEHYKDMMDLPDDLCKEIFTFAKKTMNIVKEIYNSESVYLCTMCDGPMNHFHIQLIPRYSYEKRGSRNFVKDRMEYKEDKEKIGEMRRLLEFSNYIY